MTMNILRAVIRTLLLLSIFILLVGSLAPTSHVGGPTVNDKLLHFVAYAMVGVLTVWAFQSRRLRLGFLLMLTVLGVALEFGQLFVPGRAFEVWDMIANSCGTLTALTTSRFFPTV